MWFTSNRFSQIDGIIFQLLEIIHKCRLELNRNACYSRESCSQETKTKQTRQWQNKCENITRDIKHNLFRYRPFIWRYSPKTANDNRNNSNFILLEHVLSTAENNGSVDLKHNRYACNLETVWYLSLQCYYY